MESPTSPPPAPSLRPPSRRRQRAAPLSSFLLRHASILLLLLVAVHGNLLTPISLGIDLGNHKSVVALAQGHGIDVHVNAMSRRETPSAVLFRGRRRLFGDLALAGAGAAPKSVVTHLRRLLGAALRIKDDDEMAREEGEEEGVEEEQDEEEDKCVFEPFGAGLLGKGGEDDPCRVGPQIKVRHVGRDIELSAAQVVAMLLSHLRKEVEAAHGDSNVLNTVISVPAWFGRAQRALVVDAARVARCPSPAVVTDGTALALGYGLLNMKAGEPAKVIVFVDIGHAGTQVTVAKVSGEECKVLAHAWDRRVGCDSMDRALYRLLRSRQPLSLREGAKEGGKEGKVTGAGEHEHQEKTEGLFGRGKEERSSSSTLSPRARARLLAGCVKLKKTLSANVEAFLTLECLLEGGEDVSFKISRQEAEEAWAPLVARLRKLCRMAMRRAEDGERKGGREGEGGVGKLTIDAVELVGGGSHIPCLPTAIEAEMRAWSSSSSSPTSQANPSSLPPHPPLRRTLNAAEAVARGCALAAALHSEAFRISRPYVVMDALPRTMEVRSGKGRLLLPRLERGSAYALYPKGGWEGGVEIDGEEDEEEGGVEGGGGIEVRVEEEGSGLVAARGFSRLFSKLLAPEMEEEAGGGGIGKERITTRVKLDAWGRPSVGPLQITRKVLKEKEREGVEEEGVEKEVEEVEEEEEVLGAEWEAGALPSREELEAAEALEEAMAGADREVEECLDARNALEALVYRCKGGEEPGAGAEAQAMALVVEAWLEEKEGRGVEGEDMGAVGEYEEKKESLFAALARDKQTVKTLAAVMEEKEAESTLSRRLTSTISARSKAAMKTSAAAGKEGVERIENEREDAITSGRAEEEEEGVEVVFTVEGQDSESKEEDDGTDKNHNDNKSN